MSREVSGMSLNGNSPDHSAGKHWPHRTLNTGYASPNEPALRYLEWSPIPQDSLQQPPRIREGPSGSWNRAREISIQISSLYLPTTKSVCIWDPTLTSLLWCFKVLEICTPKLL